MSEVVVRKSSWVDINWCHCGQELESKSRLTSCPRCGCAGKCQVEHGRFVWSETVHSLPVRVLRAMIGLERPRTPKMWVKWKECSDPLPPVV